MSLTHIHVRGARQHNLRDVSVSIPRNTLTVVTGLSGSGKSSLAFDTIYAEGQRRYVETLSAYARQFLDQMERPDVDSIEGLSPAISIEQKTTSRSPRSTVGTITEIYDYLRLLWASVGQPHCPNCHRPISRQSADQIVAQIVERNQTESPGERITVLAPVVRGRKGEFREELESLDKKGYRVRIDGEITEVDEGMRLEKRKNHTIEAIVDRIILKPVPGEPSSNGRAPLDTRRLQTAVITALQLANGLVLIGLQAPGGEYHETLFSSSMACPDCGINVPKLEPRSFSFNSAYGACPECNGLGSIFDFDPAKTIADWSKPLLDGAMGPGSASQYLLRLIRLAADKYKINLKKPFEELSKEDQELLLYGPPRSEAARTGFHGIIPWLRDTLEETKSEGYREYMMQYMSATECPRCHGRRLRPESLAVTIPIADAAEHPPVNRPDKDVEPVNAAGCAAVGFDCGLHGAISGTRDDGCAFDVLHRAREADCRPAAEGDYRAAGVFECGWAGVSVAQPQRGDAERRRGPAHPAGHADWVALRGVLYVLDEPSIGLHQRDNQRLISALENLRDLGNTVLVVEHDEDTIRKADYVLDLGPGAGKNGGELIAAGTPAEIMANPASVTGKYLSGEIDIVARPRRLGDGPASCERAVALGAGCALAQPAERRRALSAGRDDGGDGCEWVGQVDAGERHSVSRAGEGAVRLARGARRAQGDSRDRSARQGDPD